MSNTPTRALHLLQTPLFAAQTHGLGRMEKASLAYQRAREIVLAYDITMEDVLGLSPKFWELHQDPLMAMDGGAMTLVTIQVNLIAGSIARYAVKRPELLSLVDDLLKYRKHGQFLMTEVGHGLDIANLETTATRLPSGDFILNTPNPAAAKFMPPAVPAGLPAIALVWAKLIVDGEDRGVRPFLVPMNDGKEMCTGITYVLLPERGGPNPVSHTITTFRNVRLPPGSMLGSLEKPESPRLALTQSMWRVACGSLSVGCLVLPIIKCYATIGARYSLRRHVGPPSDRTPIISFRTQQIPVLTLVAQAYVMEAFVQWATAFFSDTTVDHRVRHTIATIVKTTIVGHANASGIAVSDRCGVQGLFAHNQMTTMHNETRGIAVAEGDILALSIKLVTEMLQGRYAVPAPHDPESLLARHESGLFAESRAVLVSAPHHRSTEVNKRVLPQCQPIIEAMGHRMAYEAAVAAGVQQPLVDLYVASCMKLDAAWYVENAGVTRAALAEMECRALDAVLPRLEQLVDAMAVEPWNTSKIVSDERWAAFVDGLEVVGGNARVDLFERDGVLGTQTARSHL